MNETKILRAFLASLVFFIYACTLGSQIDPKIDCPIKELAWSYAKWLLPEYGTFQAVYDALQLQNCNISLQSGRVFQYEAKSNKPASGTEQIFVDIAHGSDSAKGSMDAPLRTIQRAVELFRGHYAPLPTIIYLKSGMYYLSEPLKFGAEDSNLSIMGWGNDVVISGGKPYTFEWKEFVKEIRIVSGVSVVRNDDTVTNRIIKIGQLENDKSCANICYHSDECTSFTYFLEGKYSQHCFIRTDGHWYPQVTRDNENFSISGKKIILHVADLSGQELNDFGSLFINGRRAVHARYPDGNPETMGLHTNPSGYYTKAENWLPPRITQPGKTLNITEPNRTNTHFPYFQLGIGGTASNFVPPESFWAVYPPASGRYLYVIPSGMQYDSSVEFVNRTWRNPAKGLLHTFQLFHWGNWIFKIDKRINENRTVTFSRGGFQEARGSERGAEWFVENIFEELDSPGEWFLNFEGKHIFYYANGSLPSEGVGTSLDEVIIIEGSQLTPVTNFTIANIRFAHTAPTFMKDYEATLSGGDWSIHRSAAVYVEGAENFVIKNCTFDSPGGNALMLSNYIRSSVVEANEFVWVGDSAIVLLGSTNLIDGTSGDQPRGTKILGNIVHENGIFGKQTAAFMQSMACQSELRGNVFFNGPRAGVNFNDGFGGGNVMTRNLLFNYVRETGDHGPFNSWDRQPFVTKVRDGETASLVPAYNEISHNFIIANYYCSAPLDHDDGSSYYYDHHNVLVYGGYKNNIGHSKRAENNLFIYPGDAFPKPPQQTLFGGFVKRPYCLFSNGNSLGALPSGWDEYYTNNTCVFDGNSIYDLGSCKYTQLSLSSPFTANNSFYSSSADITINCGDNNLTFSEWQKAGKDKGSTINDIPPISTIISWAKDLLGMV